MPIRQKVGGLDIEIELDPTATATPTSVADDIATIKIAARPRPR